MSASSVGGRSGDRRSGAVATGDQGTVLIEAALVLPILLLLVLGLVEFATAEFQQSQASSAARDGARVGILDYRQADVTSSPAHQKVVDAVNGRLTGRTNAQVTVTCLDPAGATLTCASAVADRDRIQVEVEWPYDDVTGAIPAVPSDISATSRMRLAGTPLDTSATTSSTSTSTSTSTTTTTTNTGGCTIQSVSANDGSTSQLPRVNTNSGHLTNGLYVTVATNGSSACLPVAVVVYPEGGGQPTGTSLAAAGQSASGGIYQSIFDKNPQGVRWASGPVLIRVTWGTSGSQDLVVDLVATRASP